MTTAASTEDGRLASNPGASTSIRTMSPAPISPASWLWTPEDIATDVREALALTEKPEKIADPRFAAPRAISSLFGCDRSPFRVAIVLDRTDVSAIETRAMATAPAANGPMSASGNDGIDGDGSPGGRAPTTGTPAASWRPVTAETIVATTTATRIAGNRGTRRPPTTMNTSAATPMASATEL